MATFGGWHPGGRGRCGLCREYFPLFGAEHEKSKRLYESSRHQRATAGVLQNNPTASARISGVALMRASIVIRAYNAEASIRRAVESALSQDFPRDQYEILVVDDGSTDGTADILSGYKSEHGIRIISQQNSGAIVAANRGLKDAVGEYISYLDADDRLQPEFLSMLVSKIEADADLEMGYCDYWEERDDERHLVS